MNVEGNYNIKKEEEKFLSFLNSRNLKKTPERIEILRYAMKIKDHFGVEMIYKSMEKEGYHVSKTTVYNTMELLCSCGLFRKILIDPHQTLYEFAEGFHIHLVCSKCGRIKEKHSNELNNQFINLIDDSFQPHYVLASIYGICETCRIKD